MPTVLDWVATATGSAARVVAFFHGFQREQDGTGQAPRQAAPAVQKPIYTRAQIKENHRQHMRGAYVGREAEWARQEADIFAAQREGRVVGVEPSTGTK